MELKLDQLKKIYYNTEHLFEKHLTVEEWVSQNRPHIWWVVEKDNDLTVLYDNGHGRIALFKNEEYVDSSKASIVTEEAIVLDKNYYNVKKYIWR